MGPSQCHLHTHCCLIDHGGVARERVYDVDRPETTEDSRLHHKMYVNTLIFMKLNELHAFPVSPQVAAIRCCEVLEPNIVTPLSLRLFKLEMM